MRNKKATRKSGFCFFEHCRACTKQCSEITKDSVQSTAFLLHIAEDSKGKALSEADASLRSSQSRSGRHILPSQRSERRAKRSDWVNPAGIESSTLLFQSINSNLPWDI